ncbi:hypothetical protein QBC33DRAFT_281630 [Phialemonium atrogriseum]|uniref:Uncharacterized protein n=1 Tax=Phialemonium atrogriseum TaxID=1093897 RepID=A0AAJ0BQB1_9PEZI|nr:uncharacterized protein QBC33DRAFT_281630 [Phialemonium atrogriseum]KAK1762500.1 hypothetical protein QBC33DRAFT_281630 [Phialemonium atrogriseum]
MTTPRYVALPVDKAADDDELLKHVTHEFGDGFSASQCDVSGFSPVIIELFKAHPTDRVIVFRPQAGLEGFGCIRIRVLKKDEDDKHGDRDKQNKHKVTKNATVWEKVRGKGAYIGMIPAGCRFEAMYVDVNLVTKRGD